MGAPPVQHLQCDECGRRADERARGWRAVHGCEYPNDQLEMFFFCLDCWEREFSDDDGSSPRVIWLWEDGKRRGQDRSP
jgi:hypothetical protein